MGRRSINTTKSGKYMNPTDQARKEARKKELKKNKKQRQMVRAAVLKMKDPTQILEELQKIDEMEYNVLQPSPLNEKDKDEPEKWVELKRQEMEYDKRRTHLISYYESVKHAQSVQVDDIPLPTIQVPDNLIYGNMPLQIPLPLDSGHHAGPVKPILKKDSVYRERPAGVEPPGVPPGPPPDYAKLLQEGSKLKIVKEKKNIRFSHIVDEGPPGECNYSPPQNQGPPQIIPPPMESFDGDVIMEPDRAGSPPVALSAAAAAAAAPKPTSLQQRMLALSGQNIDDFMKEMEEVHKKRERDRAADLTARLTALKRTGPSRDSDSDSDTEGVMPPPMHPTEFLEPPGVEMRQIPPPLMPPGATISAKPQIRNLSADVTRFVPSALRVKREDKKVKPIKPIQRMADVPKQAPSKDDAYMQFMKEMEGLL
ncbi:hypothetical protein ACJJTC_014600 [Scirpophaga incertulas]